MEDENSNEIPPSLSATGSLKNVKCDEKNNEKP